MTIKIKTGFNAEQSYSVGDDEAHKAIYLFLNPEKRGVFNDGTALIGKHIQSVEPDYQATMGWNASHKLDSDDWNEIKDKGVDRKLRDVLYKAKKIAYLIPQNPQLLNCSLNEIDENGKLLLEKK